MVKLVIKSIIAILLFACCIYAEDCVQRGIGLFVGMAVACVGLLIGDSTDRREEWRDYLNLVGCALYFIFFFSIAQGIHFKETPDGVKVLSAFHTHEIDRGDRLDVKQLNSCYTQNSSKYDVQNDTYYFLHKGTSCSIYNKYGKVLTIPDSCRVLQRDYGHGKLHYFVVNGKSFDLRGTEIKDGYTPHVSDITPDYSSATL